MQPITHDEKDQSEKVVRKANNKGDSQSTHRAAENESIQRAVANLKKQYPKPPHTIPDIVRDIKKHKKELIKAGYDAAANDKQIFKFLKRIEGRFLFDDGYSREEMMKLIWCAALDETQIDSELMNESAAPSSKPIEGAAQSSSESDSDSVETEDDSESEEESDEESDSESAEIQDDAPSEIESAKTPNVLSDPILKRIALFLNGLADRLIENPCVPGQYNAIYEAFQGLHPLAPKILDLAAIRGLTPMLFRQSVEAYLDKKPLKEQLVIIKKWIENVDNNKLFVDADETAKKEIEDKFNQLTKNHGYPELPKKELEKYFQTTSEFLLEFEFLADQFPQIYTIKENNDDDDSNKDEVITNRHILINFYKDKFLIDHFGYCLNYLSPKMLIQALSALRSEKFFKLYTLIPSIKMTDLFKETVKDYFKATPEFITELNYLAEFYPELNKAKENKDKLTEDEATQNRLAHINSYKDKFFMEKFGFCLNDLSPDVRTKVLTALKCQKLPNLVTFTDPLKITNLFINTLERIIPNSAEKVECYKQLVSHPTLLQPDQLNLIRKLQIKLSRRLQNEFITQKFIFMADKLTAGENWDSLRNGDEFKPHLPTDDRDLMWAICNAYLKLNSDNRDKLINLIGCLKKKGIHPQHCYFGHQSAADLLLKANKSGDAEETRRYIRIMGQRYLLKRKNYDEWRRHNPLIKFYEDNPQNNGQSPFLFMILGGFTSAIPLGIAASFSISIGPIAWCLLFPTIAFLYCTVSLVLSQMRRSIIDTAIGTSNLVEFNQPAYQWKNPLSQVGRLLGEFSPYSPIGADIALLGADIALPFEGTRHILKGLALMLGASLVSACFGEFREAGTNAIKGISVLSRGVLELIATPFVYLKIPVRLIMSACHRAYERYQLKKSAKVILNTVDGLKKIDSESAPLLESQKPSTLIMYRKLYEAAGNIHRNYKQYHADNTSLPNADIEQERWTQLKVDLFSKSLGNAKPPVAEDLEKVREYCQLFRAGAAS